jgi:hypothetical protein
LLKYLKDNGDWGIKYDSQISFKPKIFCDAGHMTHSDGKGHGCITITMGSGFIMFRSVKIKTITLSAKESEQYVMCSAATYAYWLESFMQTIRLKQNGPIRLYQDNTAAIWNTQTGLSFARNKHVLVRRNFIREAVLEELIAVIHMASEDLPADMGTKILSALRMKKHMQTVGMYKMHSQGATIHQKEKRIQKKK